MVDPPGPGLRIVRAVGDGNSELRKPLVLGDTSGHPLCHNRHSPQGSSSFGVVLSALNVDDHKRLKTIAEIAPTASPRLPNARNVLSVLLDQTSLLIFNLLEFCCVDCVDCLFLLGQGCFQLGCMLSAKGVKGFGLFLVKCSAELSLGSNDSFCLFLSK